MAVIAEEMGVMGVVMEGMVRATEELTVIEAISIKIVPK